MSELKQNLDYISFWGQMAKTAQDYTMIEFGASIGALTSHRISDEEKIPKHLIHIGKSMRFRNISEYCMARQSIAIKKTREAAQ